MSMRQGTSLVTLGVATLCADLALTMHHISVCRVPEGEGSCLNLPAIHLLFIAGLILLATGWLRAGADDQRAVTMWDRAMLVAVSLGSSFLGLVGQGWLNPGDDLWLEREIPIQLVFWVVVPFVATSSYAFVRRFGCIRAGAWSLLSVAVAYLTPFALYTALLPIYGTGS